MRSVVLLVALAACSDDVMITRLPGSPSATRALTFFDDGQPIAIGGDSEFGLAYLQTPAADAWIRAEGIPAFDAHAALLRGNSDIFAIGETQVHRWERANSGGGFAWRSISIPFGTTANTAFAVDDLGHIFALELAPDGAGAVWTWRTDTNRWAEIPMTRPIGDGAAHFAISDSGNSVVWSVAEGIAWVDRIANTRALIPCEDVGGCTATVRGLAMRGEDVVSALVCDDDEVNGLRSVVSITIEGAGPTHDFGDVACRSIAQTSYGTTLVVGDNVYVLQPGSDDGLVRITDADPALTYTLFDASTAFAFGDGIYRIDF